MRVLRPPPANESGEPADLAAVEILRDRERGVPRYCEFRRLLDMKAPETFLDLTGGRQDLAREIEAIYGDLAKVDLMIGMLAEPYPEGFAARPGVGVNMFESENLSFQQTAGQMSRVRSLPLSELAISAISAPSLWALQTRSWHRPELQRPGSSR